MRLFSLLCSTNSADSARSVMNRLEEELGKPVISEQAMEKDAIEKLKALSGPVHV